MEDHVVLYRQYRPITFDDVVGQEAAKTALRQSVVTSKLAHAYLFCGQHGTGKTTIAKIFARAVNCEHPVNGNPCNECPTCKGILDGSILDVTEMDAASNNGVDDIRPILQEVNFAPTRTRYKVYIIDEVHMLSKGAFNALLKTIEEPPKHVMFLFATTESDKIPATIISRCQRYDFKRIPIELIAGRLREVCGKSNINASDDALRLIASRSDGALRDALSLLDQISAISGGDKEINSQDVERITGTVDSSFLFKMANCLIDARFDELIDLCEILNASGKNQARFTLDLAAYFRDLLIIRVKADPIIYLPYPKETIKDMYQTASKVSADTLTGYISYLSKEYAELRKSPDIPTSFELMLMRLCGRKSALPPTPIVIPDFEKKQAEAAATLTLSDSKPIVVPAKEESVKEEIPVKAEGPSKPEGTAKTEEPVEESLPVAEDTPEQEIKPTFVAPTPAPAPAPYRPKPSSTPTGLFSFGSSSVESPKQEPSVSPFDAIFSTKKEEPAEPATQEEPVKAEEPAASDDYVPAEDSYSEPAEPEEPAEPSIFSFMPKEARPSFSFGIDEPEEPEEPDEPAEPEDPSENTYAFTSEEPAAPVAPTAPSAGIFSGLSSSFLKDLASDIDTSDNSKEEEPKVTEPKVQTEEPVVARSQLAVQADKSGLIVDGRPKGGVRVPVFGSDENDIDTRWSNVTNSLKDSNDNIAIILEHTRLRKDGDSAYIVFEDNDMRLLANLKKSQAFRQISTGIKEEFGADHLYLCTTTQYANVEKKNRASELDKKLDDLNERSRNMGVPTDFHFGD